MKPYDIIVVGSGLSGLSNAWYLQQQGAHVAVLEASTRTGGIFRSDLSEGWLADLGANSAVLKPQLAELVQALGLDSEMIEANRACNKRYIYYDGSLHELPLTFSALLSSQLLPMSAKLRLLKEPFIRHIAAPEQSVEQLFQHRLGAQWTERVIDPFVSGTWAGDIRKLDFGKAFVALEQGLKQYGSLFKLAVQRSRQSSPIVSFRLGMAQLTDTLFKALKQHVYLNQSVINLHSSKQGWTVTTNQTVFQSQQLVLSTPCQQWSDWLSLEAKDDKRAVLEHYPTAPTTVFAYRFKRSDIGHALDGFGVLFPRSQRIRTLGVLFSSAMFSHRCSEDEIVLTAFIGGSQDSTAVQQPVAELSQIVLAELESILTIKAPPLSVKSKAWIQGIPQYNYAHHNLYEHTVSALEQSHQGLWIASNYHNGVSVSDRIKTAKTLANLMNASIG